MMYWPEPYIQVAIFIFGALLGSFANVVIYRYPKGESVVSPRSSCTSCKKMIPWQFNIPIVSWLMLLGKCRFCKSKISMTYFLVEVFMATLFVLSYQKFHFSFFFFESLIFIFGLVTISMIDFEHYIIPDLFSLGGVLIGLVGAFINPDRSFLMSFVGVAIGGGFLYFVSYIYFLIRKEMGIGGGDIKLLAWVGAVLGAISIPFVIIFSCLVGSLVGVGLMLKSKSGFQQRLAFGPYISLAALIYLIWGDQIINSYLTFVVR